MLCENCGERRAEIHLVTVINGVRAEEDICRECAENLTPFHEAAEALKMSFSLEGILSAEDALRNLLLPMLPDICEIGGKDLKCPHCGKEIEPDELFGKLQALDKQAKDIVFDFSRIRPETAKRDSNAQPETAPAEQDEKDALCSEEQELAGLSKELEFALLGERYERAAEIRDRIEELKKTIGNRLKGA